jgi:hypothetical protein
MSQLIGFSLSPAIINRQFIGIVPWCLAGLAFPLFFGKGSLSSAMWTAAIVVALISPAYWLARRTKWLHLSSVGIQGFNKWGTKATILWSDPMTFSLTTFNGLSCIEIKSKGNAIVLVPLPVFESAEFKTSLKQLAPPEHPLVSIQPNAL